MIRQGKPEAAGAAYLERLLGPYGHTIGTHVAVGAMIGFTTRPMVFNGELQWNATLLSSFDVHPAPP
jgi:hypothetical protein